MGTNNSYMIDILLEMKDAGAITADAAAQVGGSNKIIDLGEGFVEGNLLIDVSAIDFTTGDETYDLIFQLSSKSDFATVIANKIKIQYGDARGGSNDLDQNFVGREVVPFNNEHQGVIYQFARMFTDVGGTTPSINYTANLTKQT